MSALKNLLCTGAISAATLGAVSAVPAAVIVEVESTGGVSQFANSVGFRFQVGSEDLLVEALGAINIDGNFGTKAGGLASDVPVAIWTDAGALVTNLTLPAGTGPGERYVFVDLPTAVTLTAGEFYRVGAVFAPGSGDFYRNPEGSPSPVFNTTDFVAGEFSSRYADAGGLAFPDGGYVVEDSAYSGPNFRYSIAPDPVVPEPAAALPAASAVLLLGRRRRA